MSTRQTLTPLLLAVLALLSAFTPLSIDMYLPALPVIAVDLRGSAGDIQLTLSAFMIAFGAGQIFYGPAGDRFGRRPVILGGLVVYILASAGCAFAAAAVTTDPAWDGATQCDQPKKSTLARTSSRNSAHGRRSKRRVFTASPPGSRWQRCGRPVRPRRDPGLRAWR